MAVRDPALTRAIIALTLLCCAVQASAATPAEDWWAGLPRAGAPHVDVDRFGHSPEGASGVDGRGGAAKEPRWYDALDLGASLWASSSSAALGADLTLRLRLDATEYLARVRDERAELAELASALEGQDLARAQLDWLARRCEGVWRAWQARFVRSALDSQPAPALAPLELAHLQALESYFAAAASRPAEREDVLECRLEGLTEGLVLASGHPRLSIASAERRLTARTVAMMSAPGPPSFWLQAGLAAGDPGGRASVRFGLDLPLPAAASDLDLSLTSDGAGVDARLRWHRAGAAPRPPTTPSPETHTPTEAQLFGHLSAELRRRLLEAELMRADADLRWNEVCPGFEPVDLEDCLHGIPYHLGLLDGLLMAVDAELAALRASLAALGASGHQLDALLSQP